MNALRRLFSEAHALAERDARVFLASAAAAGPDRRVIAVCATAALALALPYYAGDLTVVLRWLGPGRLAAADPELWRLSWWAMVVIASYAVLPALVVRVALRESPLDLGLRASGSREDARVFAILLAVVLALVVLFSATQPFQRAYPLYKPSSRPAFLVWEAIYLAQIVAVEVFFRGFLLHGTRHRFGFHAVFVAAIPYTMVHFGKPPAECASALVTGILLGAWSLRSGSIWPGAAVHVLAALAMDLASLWRKGAAF